MKKNAYIIALILLTVLIPVLLCGFSDGPQKVYKYRDQAWLGVKTQDMTGQLRKFFGVAEDKGILITETVKESPAAEKNLKAGDVIIKADGEWIRDSKDLAEIINEFEPGETLSLTISRDQQEQEIAVELGRTKRRYHPYLGYRPGRYEVRIPEIDVDIPDVDIEIMDRDELNRLKKEVQEELKLHQEELKENLEELKENLKEMQIEFESNEVL